MAVLIMLTAGIAGCASQAPSAGQATPTDSPVTTTVPAAPPALPAEKTPSVPGSSEYALQPAEIPANFTLVESRERSAFELSQWAREHGWMKGYSVVYQKNDPSSPSGTVITQNISVYSGENATLAVTDTIDEFADWVAKENNANQTVEKLSLEKIGNASGSLKFFDKNENRGRYVIAFAKNGVFEDIGTNGTAADYEAARQVATAAAAKIR